MAGEILKFGLERAHSTPERPGEARLSSVATVQLMIG